MYYLLPPFLNLSSVSLNTCCSNNMIIIVMVPGSFQFLQFRTLLGLNRVIITCVTMYVIVFLINNAYDFAPQRRHHAGFKMTSSNEQACKTKLLVTFLALWPKFLRRNWFSKTTKFLGGKSAVAFTIIVSSSN